MSISIAVQLPSVQNKLFHFLPVIWHIFIVTLKGTIFVSEITEAIRHSHRCPHANKHEIMLHNCYTHYCFSTALKHKTTLCILNSVTQSARWLYSYKCNSFKNSWSMSVEGKTWNTDMRCLRTMTSTLCAHQIVSHRKQYKINMPSNLSRGRKRQRERF